MNKTSHLSSHCVAGIDIGGTKCAVSLGRLSADETDIEIISKVKFATPKCDPYGTVDLLCKELETMCQGSTINAIGVSCGGPLDSKKGIILSPPGLPGWDSIPVTDIFRNRFDVPCALQNDANACALAEWRFGAGRGFDNIIFLTFGTGLGAGLILDGKLYSGTNDMAGEVGHIRLSPFGPVGYGKSGSFEGFCSGGGIAELAKMKAKEAFQCGRCVSYCDSKNGDFSSITAKTVADSADAGNADAAEVYRISGEYLGKGLSVLVDILNPQRIIIGSVFARSENLFREAMEKSLREEACPKALEVCKVVPAMLGEKLGDYAALAVAENADS